MEKKRKWQRFLILAVIGLTLYNILPTVFYYLKPLKRTITQGEDISSLIQKRVNGLETHSTDWLSSFCNLLEVKPASISIEPENPQWISVKFSKLEDANRFRRFLPRAGSLIPFNPAQLGLAPQSELGKEVLVQRRIPIHFETEKEFFSFTTKREPNGTLAPLYRQIIIDRAAQIALSLGGVSESASLLSSISDHSHSFNRNQIEALAAQINLLNEIFPEKSSLSDRYRATLTQNFFKNKTVAVQNLISAFDHLRDEIKQEKNALDEAGKRKKEENSFLSEEDVQRRRLLEKKELALISAGNALKKHEFSFAAGQDPWEINQIESALLAKSEGELQNLSIGLRNPIFSDLTIDWSRDKIFLKLHADVASFRSKSGNKSSFEQLLINEVAKVAHLTNEELFPEENGYAISLQNLPNAASFLVLNLGKVAEVHAEQIRAALKTNWNPKHPDLQNLAIVDIDEYQKLPLEQKALCLIVHSPVASKNSSPLVSHLRNNSLYMIAKGMDQILQNYEQFPDSEPARAFGADFRSLAEILRQNGFVGYRGSIFQNGNTFQNDFIFEKNNFSQPLIAATREDFSVRGTQKYAVLELSDLEQRILTTNKIETRIHEDLQKWKDEYHAAQVSLNPSLRYDVPKPTKSVFWSNLTLSISKLFRGDERKIIRWGLDLSGGKTVQIELRDTNNQVVKNEADLKQGINELYNRVNKMGVSEVTIRQVGHQIVLDFPSSQSLSASELIRASSMYFHILNEKMSPNNPILAESVNRFLQEVWNEAVVSNRKDSQSINAIAWKHLHGDSNDPETVHPQSEAARTLFENGLRLASPQDQGTSNTFNDTISKIAIFRGSDFNEWHGQTHPLLFVFRNYALEGSQLDNIRSSYDPSKGNFLSFEVRGNSQNREGQKVNPRNELYSWTSRFSKEKISGTTNEAYSQGKGWRMAVILNDTVISAPTLDSALRDSAMISGSFSQREVNQLAADLKAGSLSFTPHILSEKNVSPELGQSDRLQGIAATFISLILVIASMVLYYRFAGLVASVAVLFNLLIIWATLQNLGATLTLAGIAGIILNIGMAIDANVLVFERIKEEFAITGKISSAIEAGYKKAYSAIIDSNVTTIIAALILLNFDAGPIKSFAITLIIGIASSMFTALFMTRYYFAGWAANPKNKTLTMSNWIRAKKINFLKQAKGAFAIAALFILAGGYLVYAQRSTIFGMDFTGGVSLNLEIAPNSEKNYAKAVEHALASNGASPRDFQVRELNPSNHLRVLFGTSMEQSGKPFYQMPVERDLPNPAYSYEKNPRIEWVVKSLESAGLSLSSGSLKNLDANWTAMSGQMSDAMRNNALIGLLISFVCIFIYIAFRFEYKFAAAAIICLLHDVLITIGLIGLLNAIGVPVQIDLNTVAALMTIVGYSLNDTIIIFDRIREEMRFNQRKNLSVIVNGALNSTLSRTSITSGTTLLVLLALVALGGSSIFSFALVMIIGVFFGTLSSWYIASPLMLFFHGREESKEKEMVQQV